MKLLNTPHVATVYLYIPHAMLSVLYGDEDDYVVIHTDVVLQF